MTDPCPEIEARIDALEAAITVQQTVVDAYQVLLNGAKAALELLQTQLATANADWVTAGCDLPPPSSSSSSSGYSSSSSESSSSSSG